MGRNAVAILTLCVVVACGDQSPPNSLRAELARVRQAGAGATVDLARAVQGEWDTVVVLNPYSSTAESDAVIGYSWRSNKQSVIMASDSHNLLVFMKKGRVRYAELLERNQGDFCCFERNGRYPREAAVFSAVLEGNWLRLRNVRAPAG